MNRGTNVIALVEGQTESLFVKNILAPYLAEREIFIEPIMLHKKGQSGGDVKFLRAIQDIGNHLRQRRDTCVTLMVDYYGLDPEWPGFAEAKLSAAHTDKAKIINQATAKIVQEHFPEENRGYRFIPYISMHEIEALYFSCAKTLAGMINIKPNEIEKILLKYGKAEAIDDGFDTAPSKRLTNLFPHFKKTVTGISIAQNIGVGKMREACPLFNDWVGRLENLPTPYEVTAE